MGGNDIIARLIDAEKKATPGPWVWWKYDLVSKPALDLWEEDQRREEDQRNDTCDSVDDPSSAAIITTDSGVYGPGGADAEFIALAREGVPAMAARLVRYEKAITEYLAEVDNPAPDYGHRRQLRERLRAALKDNP